MKLHSFFATLPLVLSILISTPGLARSELHLTRAERRPLLKSIFCARSLTQNKSFPEPGKILAMDILQRAHAEVGNPLALSEIASECERTLSEVRSGEFEKFDPGFENLKKRYPDWISLPEDEAYPGAPLGVQRLIKNFRRALYFQADCTLLGPEVVAGLGAAFSAGASAGLCRRSDGRRWIAIGTHFGVGFGFGGAVGVHVEREGYDGSNTYLEPQAEIGAFLGTGSLDEYELTGNEDDKMIGVGLGVFYLVGLDFQAKIISLGTNRRKILGEFLAE